MDVRYINPFIGSISNIFETMCGLRVIVGKPVFQTEPYDRIDVSAIIGFSGDVVGSVALCFDTETACKFASAFAGTDITLQHEDFVDALGELASILAGNAKAKLEGLRLNISLPDVIIGQGHQILASKSTPHLHLPCSTDAGNFHVEVRMEICKKHEIATEAATIGTNK